MGLHVEYITSALGPICVMWQAYLFREYANNVKCMYNSACGDSVDRSEFIWGLYTDIVTWYLHMNLFDNMYTTEAVQ